MARTVEAVPGVELGDGTVKAWMVAHSVDDPGTYTILTPSDIEKVRGLFAEEMKGWPPAGDGSHDGPETEMAYGFWLTHKAVLAIIDPPKGER